MSEVPPTVVGKRALSDLPPEVTHAIVRTSGAFTAPKGWVEVGGSMHVGRGIWLIRVCREADDA